MPAVVIAAVNLMPSLQERLAPEGELLTFADTEPIQALQAILEHRPSLIVLERLFAATPRGAALINRIKTDPQLGNAEVRVMSHSGDYSRQVARPQVQATASGAAAVQSQPLGHAHPAGVQSSGTRGGAGGERPPAARCPASTSAIDRKPVSSGQSRLCE